MERLGLIERVSDKDDRRVTLVYLTAKGRSVCAGVQATFKRFCEDALAGLSEGEAAAFSACMEKIVARISGGR